MSGLQFCVILGDFLTGKRFFTQFSNVSGQRWLDFTKDFCYSYFLVLNIVLINLYYNDLIDYPYYLQPGLSHLSQKPNLSLYSKNKQFFPTHKTCIDDEPASSLSLIRVKFQSKVYVNSIINLTQGHFKR